METKIITRVNGVDILSTSGEQKLVPVRPICEALGIAYQSQLQKLKDDEDLSSVITLSVTTGADGKQYEMVCLPLEFIFGWLFTTNPKNVKEEAQNAVRIYRMECYKALYQYFTEPQTFLREKQIAIEAKVNDYQDCQRRFKDAQRLMNDAKSELNSILKYTIEEWRFNNRQLVLPFKED